VCAAQFDAVDEVVQHGINGVIFDSSEDLYSALINLLSHDDELGNLRRGVQELGWQSWSEEWDNLAKPIFT